MRVLVTLAVLFVPAAPLLAQQRVDCEVVVDRARASSARVNREISCLSGVLANLQRIELLIVEAERQMQTTTGAARRDAEDAVRSLEQRIGDLERQAVACRQPVPASATSSIPPEGVEVRDPPPDPTADRVATQNPGTQLVEQDGPLATNVRIVQGEQVDGRGRVDRAAVRSAIRGAGPAISACYDTLVGRGRLQSGHVLLTFTITPSGSITRVSTEGSTLRNSTFDRCVRRAGAAMRSRAPAVGGDATYTYTLALPGDDE
jgi:TonB family protein